MRQFLLCSTVFSKKQYVVLDIPPEKSITEELNYLLVHRNNAIVWPLFTKVDVQECLNMDRSLTSLLQEVIIGKENCRIKYNGLSYEVYEISSSSVITGYWKIITNCGSCLFDPNYIEFIGA